MNQEAKQVVAKIEVVKPSSSACVGYDAWAQQHKEQTGEDVSFF